jgi:hypothetical protein
MSTVETGKGAMLAATREAATGKARAREKRGDWAVELKVNRS